MKYKIVYSNQFNKNLRRYKSSGRFDLDNFHRVADLLAGGENLPPQYRDHPLHGFNDDTRECHIGPDLLLVYKKYNNALILYLLRLGSHSDLFD